MLRFFQLFLDRMKTSFRSLSKATKHEMAVEDLHGDAWIVAHEISAKRGHDIDFSNADDQSLIMRAVNVRNLKRGDWKFRQSIRIDQEAETDEAAFSWAERLPARASSDPLIELLQRESSLKRDALLSASYSQASAYVMVFIHFKNDRQEVCSYLVLSDGALSRRVTVAADTVRVQPSLFDRIERIEPSFMPLAGQHRTTRSEQHLSGAQWGWAFDEALTA